jgi:hypothetical protein
MTWASLVYQRSGREWAVKVFVAAPLQAAGSVGDFVVGSRLRIMVDPENPERAEAHVGLNLQFLFLPLLTCCIAVVLGFVASRYWKVHRTAVVDRVP